MAIFLLAMVSNFSKKGGDIIFGVWGTSRSQKSNKGGLP
jgi:hypothetical protein